MITINGQKFEGKDLVIVGNTIFIDGVNQTSNIAGCVEQLSKNNEIKIEINGSVEKLECDKDIIIKGKCELTNIYGDGDVICNDIFGNVKAGGDITCNLIYGDAQAGGDIF